MLLCRWPLEASVVVHVWCRMFVRSLATCHYTRCETCGLSEIGANTPGAREDHHEAQQRNTEVETFMKPLTEAWNSLQTYLRRGRVEFFSSDSEQHARVQAMLS